MFTAYTKKSTYVTSQKSLKYIRDDFDYGFLMNLPSHIILDILSRLPVKAIVLCKCVCKEWLDLISTPYFLKLQFSMSTSRPGLVVYHSEMFKNFIRLIDYGDGYYHRDLQCDQGFTFKLSSLSTYPDADIVVDGSVNGFLFLRDVNYKHETLFICNPVTREYVVLPQPESVVLYPSVVTHGFGASAISGQYKVVRIFQERLLHHITGSCLRILNSECEVYTLGTGSWRRIGKVPLVYNSNYIGLPFKGNLHWLVEDFEESEMISCFDLETELFRPFPPPFSGGKLLGSLSVLNGFLCLCDNTSFNQIDIWVMKEYGVKKSWTKEFVINKMPKLIGPVNTVVYAHQIFQDGVLLLLWGDFFMLFYDTKTQTYKEVDLNQTRGPNSIEAMHHVSSFLSLRNLAKEEEVYINHFP